MRRSATGRVLISVVLRDRVGILRDIAAVVTGLGGNIDAISQTVVAHYFTALLGATYDRPCRPEDLRARLTQAFRGDAASIHVEEFRDPARAARPAPAERYILTLTGADRKGVMLRVFSFLARRKINVTDWSMHTAAGRATYIGEVEVALGRRLDRLQAEFRALLAAMNMTGGFQHENIFRATSEVGALRALPRRRA